MKRLSDYSLNPVPGWLKARCSAVFFLLAAALIYFAYSNTFLSPPVLDDFHSFIEEPRVYVKDWSIASILSLSETKFGLSRWIPMLTFAWDHGWGGGSIAAFHTTNFLIHLSCFVSVFLMVSQLMKTPKAQNSKPESTASATFYLALWTAALWALHPVQTNAVTYIVQRMTSLMTLFYVLSMVCYLYGRRIQQKSGISRRVLVLYAFATVCGLCSLVSKENSVMLPVMLVLTELWFFQPDLFRKVYRHLGIKHWLILLLLLVLFLAMVFHLSAGIFSGFSGRHFTVGQRLLTELRIVVWYFYILLWPSPGRLSLEHDVDLSLSLVHPPTTLLSLLLLCALVAVVWRWRKELPLMTYGIAWFLLNLVIESTIVPLELVFEHRVYLPSIGLFLALVSFVKLILDRLALRVPTCDLHRLSWCLFCVLVSVLSLTTFYRNEVWRSRTSLYADTVKKAPQHPRAHANLGMALVSEGRCYEAIQEAGKALALGRKNFENHSVATNTIVSAWIRLGDMDKAILEGEGRIKDFPSQINGINLPVLFRNLALAYRETGQYEKAYQRLFHALELSKSISDTQTIRVIEHDLFALLQSARLHPADLDGDGAPDPGDLPAKSWIGKQFLKVSDEDTALRLLEEASLEAPDNSETQDLLAVLKSNRDKTALQELKGTFFSKYVRHPFSTFNASMAVAFLIREKRLPSPMMQVGEFFLNCAMELKPNAADVHLLKGWYHYDKKEPQEAVAAARRSLDIDPEYARAWLGYGFFLVEAKQYPEALAAFQKSLELYPGSPQEKTIQAIVKELKEKMVASN